MTSKIKFKEPPPEGQNRGAYDWADIAKKLRRRAEAKPGDPESWWAVIFEQDATHLAQMLARGDVTVLSPERGFESVTRNNTRSTPRVCDLWMRYNPELDTEKEK